jgi:aspartyl-tRNA(Asn)/glutamyl-tRNA(Gln) amidotransferase subunit C
MKLRKEQVEHVAMLARLALTPEELEMFSTQLSDILEYMDKLNQLDTKEVAPLFHAIGIENVLREDETRPSLAREEALSNSPERGRDSFKVPKVID